MHYDPRSFLPSEAINAMSTETSSPNAVLVVGPHPRVAPARTDREPPVAAHSAISAFWRFLRREPLVHFCVLGALIFGADAILHPPKKDDRTILVTKTMRQSFIDNFDEDKARVPSDEELQKMIDSWVASEILYREGKSLAVDRGDEMIRDRIAYKLQLLIFDQVKVAQPTDEELRDWFAQNHQRFDEPERVGFYLTPPTDEASARRQLQDIQAQRESPELQKQTRAILARPLPSVAPAFGEGFRDALLGLPLGQWNVLQSKDGWHVARLDSRRPGSVAKLDDVRDQAARIWHTDETRKRAWEAVNRLKAQYAVRYEQ
jgi:hypothetical protein